MSMEFPIPQKAGNFWLASQQALCSMELLRVFKIWQYNKKVKNIHYIYVNDNGKDNISDKSGIKSYKVTV
jgi:hypothetical protein